MDVLIIGGGPAGLLAAKTLAKLGLSVLVLERNDSYDKISRACSMQLVLDDDYEGEGIQIREDSLYFPISNFSVLYHGTLVPIYHKYYHSPKDHKIHFARENGNLPLSYKFDKALLLKELYQECLQLGVSIRLNSLALSGIDCKDHVEVTYRCFHGTSTVRAQKLLIAEGTNAELTTQMGLNARRPHITTALCQKFYLRGLQSIQPNSWNLYYGRAYQTNAPLVIGPSLISDEIHELTITGDFQTQPAEIYQAACKLSPLAKELTRAEVLCTSSCSIDAYLPMQTPYHGNVLVIGDAAAYMEVEVQGAFLCGFHAAHAIFYELLGENGFAGYADWWKNSFEFNREDHMQVSQGYALVPTYTDKELDYLFALLEHDCLYGTYSQYKTSKLIWNAIHTHRSKIETEFPGLYAKILRNPDLTLSSTFSRRF